MNEIILNKIWNDVVLAYDEIAPKARSAFESAFQGAAAQKMIRGAQANAAPLLREQMTMKVLSGQLSLREHDCLKNAWCYARNFWDMNSSFTVEDVRDEEQGWVDSVFRYDASERPFYAMTALLSLVALKSLAKEYYPEQNIEWQNINKIEACLGL